MSNRAVLVATKFTTLHDNAETLGFRIYDEYGMEYANTFEVGDDLENDTSLLHHAKNVCTDVGQDIIDFSIEGNGMEINGTWYESEEVGAMLNDEPGK